MAERIEPAALLARLLDELDKRPPSDHLAALEALNRHDVELVLTDHRTVTVVVGPCTVEIPLADLVVDAPVAPEAEPFA